MRSQKIKFFILKLCEWLRTSSRSDVAHLLHIEHILITTSRPQSGLLAKGGVPQYSRKNVLLTYTQRVSALSLMRQSPEGHINAKSCDQLVDRLKERTEDITATGHWFAKCSQRTLWVIEH